MESIEQCKEVQGMVEESIIAHQAQILKSECLVLGENS
jgi:hypothetical protein